MLRDRSMSASGKLHHREASLGQGPVGAAFGVQVSAHPLYAAPHRRSAESPLYRVAARQRMSGFQISPTSYLFSLAFDSKQTAAF